MSDADPYRFRALLGELEHVLVQALELQPQPLDASLCLQEGQWRGETVRLTARAYRSPHISWARFVEVSGPRVAIANLLCLSQPALALPILGMDFVWTGTAEAVAVADLSPVWEPSAQDFEHSIRRAGGPSLSSAGTLPGWAQRWFSSSPLFARVKPDEAPLVEAAVRPYVDVFARAARQACALPERAERVRHLQDRYCQAHRDEDSGLRLLGKLFGEAWAKRFLECVLFPPPPA